MESDISYLPLYVDEEKVHFNHKFISQENNSLDSILPEFKHLSHCVFVVNVKSLNNGKCATIYMDGENDEAMALLD